MGDTQILPLMTSISLARHGKCQSTAEHCASVLDHDMSAARVVGIQTIASAAAPIAVLDRHKKVS